MKNDVQFLGKQRGIRIKFASINADGGYEDDCHDEYITVFPETTGDLAEDWKYSTVDGMIDTRFEHTRSAWRFSYRENKVAVAAVEHETGVEILVGIAAGVATEAISGLVKWAWNKWSEARRIKVLAPSLVLERVTERFPDASIRCMERSEIRGRIDKDHAHKLVENWLTRR